MTLKCAKLTFHSAFLEESLMKTIQIDVFDLDKQVQTLRKLGVKFEQYDLADFKSVNGIVDYGNERRAFTKDRQGNLIIYIQAKIH